MIFIHLNLLSNERKSLVHDIRLRRSLQWSAIIILGTYLTIVGILWVGKMFLETEKAQYGRIVEGKQATLAELRQEYLASSLSVQEELKTIQSLQSSFVLWSETLRDLASVPPKGITLQEVTFRANDKTFLFRGTAETREVLLWYRDALLVTDAIETLEAPVSTFTQKENIAFQFTGTFNPSLLISQ